MFIIISNYSINTVLFKLYLKCVMEYFYSFCTECEFFKAGAAKIMMMIIIIIIMLRKEKKRFQKRTADS